MSQIYKLKEEIERLENSTTTTNGDMEEYRIITDMMELVLNQLCTWVSETWYH